ncbi:MAG: ABC transporter permease, partial [Muribaculaceae bacterium]|nr:ABC transporter permease [Muribaculaceae bacterium]
MRYELFISRKLRLGKGDEKSTSPSLTIAIIGIVLAVVVMILTLVIVTGFKQELTDKIYSLDSHIKITKSAIGNDEPEMTLINYNEIAPAIQKDKELSDKVSTISLQAVKSTMLKTDENFKVVEFKGVDKGFDWKYIGAHLVDGRLPESNTDDGKNEIIVSQSIANELGLAAGDRVMTYFFTDGKVKVRKTTITGIYNTDFDRFDNLYVIGDIKTIQSICKWKVDEGNYVGVNLKSVGGNLDEVAYDVYKSIVGYNLNMNDNQYYVSQTKRANIQFFAWLDMLNINVVIILVLMFIVAAFTLISALLMIVLDRIKMIGTLKALGASNSSIRRIFIYLTSKLIIKSLVIANVVGIGLALLQQHFHIVKLNAE